MTGTGRVMKYNEGWINIRDKEDSVGVGQVATRFTA